MGLLDGKRLLITGVITDASIAFSVARLAQEQGAKVVLTGYGRMSLVERVAKRLPQPPPVIELDVSRRRAAGLARRPRPRARRRPRRRRALDRVRAGVLPGRRLPGHAVGGRRDRGARVDLLAEVAGRRPACRCSASRAARSSGMTSTPRWPGRPTTGWAWPRPGWSRRRATWPASSARAASGSTSISAGPLRTMAAKSIPGFSAFEDAWDGPGAAGLGQQRHRAGRPQRRRPAVGLVPGHHRRDRPRRRRLPRDGRLMHAAYDALLAAVLRRTRGPRRRHAVPAQRHARAGASPTSGSPRSPSTTSTSTASRRSTSRTGR